jgi:drug/metabolite transporter (DMT)-like permease
VAAAPCRAARLSDNACAVEARQNGRVQARTIVALILAFASTTLVSLAYLREHGAVAGMPPLSLRRPLRSLRLLLRSRAWLLGFAMETAGFGLYVAALALAPLALVQSVAAGGIGILAVASWRLGGRRLSRREVVGAALSVAGLALLAISLAGGAGSGEHGSLAAIALWLGATVVVAVLVLTSGRALFGRGVADGIAGGMFFAAGDICTKLATAGGARLLFIFGMIPAYVLGTSLLQIGYQSAAALTVAGIATLLTNALPIAAGTVLLHEPLPSGALGVIRILAFATVTAGAILLARPEPRGGSEPAHASSS